MNNEELRLDPHLDASHYEDVLEKREDRDLTIGERLSDKIADFGGSWSFIICFIGFMVLWVLANVVLLQHPVDAYPFVFLNLILSMIAALQAPVIMMSQRRQDDRDRERSAYHLELTRRSARGTELELRRLRRQVALMINQSELRDSETEIDVEDRLNPISKM